MRDVVYLTVAEVVQIHHREVGETAVDVGGLDGTVNRPRHSAFGSDAFPDIHTKAAALFQGLACTQYFVDGNKRTAVAAVIVFYGLNGYDFVAEQGDLFSFVMDVANKVLTENEQIAAHLERFAVPPPDDYE